MEPREEQKREKAPEPPKEEPRPRRFRIVKLEERIAPLAAHPTGCTEFESGCL
jgi:hypothetical protein